MNASLVTSTFFISPVAVSELTVTKRSHLYVLHSYFLPLSISRSLLLILMISLDASRASVWKLSQMKCKNCLWRQGSFNFYARLLTILFHGRAKLMCFQFSRSFQCLFLVPSPSPHRPPSIKIPLRKNSSIQRLRIINRYDHLSFLSVRSTSTYFKIMTRRNASNKRHSLSYSFFNEPTRNS